MTERYPKPSRIVRRKRFVYCVFETVGDSDRLALVSTWKTRSGATGEVEAREAERDGMVKAGYPSSRKWFVAGLEVLP